MSVSDDDLSLLLTPVGHAVNASIVPVLYSGTSPATLPSNQRLPRYTTPTTFAASAHGRYKRVAALLPWLYVVQFIAQARKKDKGSAAGEVNLGRVLCRGVRRSGRHMTATQKTAPKTVLRSLLTHYFLTRHVQILHYWTIRQASTAVATRNDLQISRTRNIHGINLQRRRFVTLAEERSDC